MSYSIIFQTKFIKLADGRYIHLSREGCNNDNAGREKGVYSSKIYTASELNDYIEKFVGNDGEIKIASRWTTLDGYAKHLKRMLKKAQTWEEIKKQALEKGKYAPYVRYLTKVETESLSTGEKKDFTPKEWDKVCYDYWFDYSHRYTYGFTYDIDEISQLFNDNVPHLEFHIA